MMLELVIRGGHLFDPADRGRVDMRIRHGKIVEIAPRLEVSDGAFDNPGTHTVWDASGLIIVPSLVDSHLHVIGGGGAGGPSTQCPPIVRDEVRRAGIGTFVGCLGFDTLVRSAANLLTAARAYSPLGIRSYVLTGSIDFPVATLSGSVAQDIFLVPEVVGCKAAVGESVGGIRSSAQLQTLIDQVVRGSRASGKKPLLHLHMSDNTDALALIDKEIGRGFIPPDMITLTHVNWSADSLQASAKVAAHGINLDVTSAIRPLYFPGTISPAVALATLQAEGVPWEQVTLSSDAGGAHVDADGELVAHSVDLLLQDLTELVKMEVMSFTEALSVVTRNPLGRFTFERGPLIAEGMTARLLALDENMQVNFHVIGTSIEGL